MFFKKLMITLIVIAMMAGAGLLIQSCNDNPTEPVNTLAEVNHGDDGSGMAPPEDNFIQDLQDGEYQFALDDDGNLLPLDGSTIPEVEQSLYELFLTESEISDQKGLINEPITTSTTTSYWRYAIYREICYALSKIRYLAGAWGTSTRIYYRYGYWFAGDWDYCGYGIGSGGPSCKEFAWIVVARATGNRYILPTGYDYASGSIAWCCPGDVIQRSDYWGIPHTAIVFKVLQRDSYGRATVIDVIDNNFIASRLIARHVLPLWGYELYQFKVW